MVGAPYSDPSVPRRTIVVPFLYVNILALEGGDSVEIKGKYFLNIVDRV